MPAAAVIPAPVAYIKFVAVKKLVVGLMHDYDSFKLEYDCFYGLFRYFTLKKLERS